MKITVMIRLFLFTMILWFVAQTSQGAVNCKYENPNRPATAIMPSQINSLVVPRDMPIGTRIYMQEFHQTQSMVRFLCDVLSATTIRSFRAYGMGAKSNVNVGPYAGKIYDTGVRGIGVAWIAGPPGVVAVMGSYTAAPQVANSCNASAGQNIPAGSCSTGDLPFASAAAMVLVKTGEVQGGVIDANALGSLSMSMTLNNDSPAYVLGSIGVRGSIQVVGATCKTPNVNVPMGRHGTSALKGIGSGTPKIDFVIRLTDCPGFPGYYGNTDNGAIPASSETGVSNAGIVVKNSVSVRIEPASAAIDAPRGILGLVAAPDSAVGIGVQLLDNSGTPRALSQNVPLPDVLGADTRSLNIYLGARYLQTADTVRPGKANAVATYTIIYQ
jgi:major type 1 subunit fimbrin (pilin)